MGLFCAIATLLTTVVAHLANYRVREMGHCSILLSSLLLFPYSVQMLALFTYFIFYLFDSYTESSFSAMQIF